MSYSLYCLVLKPGKYQDGNDSYTIFAFPCNGGFVLLVPSYLSHAIKDHFEDIKGSIELPKNFPNMPLRFYSEATNVAELVDQIAAALKTTSTAITVEN